MTLPKLLVYRPETIGASPKLCNVIARSNATWQSVSVSKNRVIARSSAHWRGNPPDFETFLFQNIHILLLFRGLPHQRARWFAMTVGFFMLILILLREGH